MAIKLPSKNQRLSNFKQNWLPELDERYSVYERPIGSYSIDVDEIGIIDYYPKSDRILFRSENEWGNAGLAWIGENLLDK